MTARKKSPPRIAALAANKAFLHVVNEHRWLAACACRNWRALQSDPTRALQARGILPNVDVALSAAILAYARSLIEFYTKGSALPTNKQQPRETDVVVEDFGLSLDQNRFDALDGFKNSIEVHLLHITAWRDPDYRRGPAAESQKQRFDWNTAYLTIVDMIHGALNDVASRPSPWQRPFADLSKASVSRYQDPKFRWPTELTEKNDVEQYLTRLGL